MKPNTRLKHFGKAICLLTLIAFSSCKKDNNAGIDETTEPTLKISSATYEWGELAINKKDQVDSIAYNSDGKIQSVLNYDIDRSVSTNVGFSYQNNQFTLDSRYNDTYEVDALGRVTTHKTYEVQNGYDIIHIQRFTYDENGYLNKVIILINFDGKEGEPYSTINYEVVNGNYTKFALVNTDGTVTRQYVLKYNTSKKVYNPGALFAPIFAANTTVNIDKYLNYGKASVNLLTGVDFTIKALNNTVTSGSFTAVTETDADNYLTSLQLTGDQIQDFPSDNLSPLPRSIKFSYKK
ncbi:hypothetical protein IM792_20160 [Mucilaginibacter sp. JRF]|uniref:hypothetical protein n=1 Tax=Mucilaginibacter sp. JRF TaxID=2780088 RepID=UPI00187DE8F4|nr:hypothetical protein [Mucilaginibacter sp. JRF]MBE9586775.1 hypothetical protein [Mucilaginibacter sp. JRF]